MVETEKNELTGGGIELAPGVLLPSSALTFVCSRSGGPGGQHVNKTATRVQLRVSLAELAPLLSEAAVQRLRRAAGSRLGKDGVLQLVSAENRSQQANRRACVERLCQLVQQALKAPRVRRQRRLSPAARQRRLNEKKRRGEIKRLRRRPPGGD